MNVVEKRDFSNFELGDNVYALAGGLIPKIAEKLDVEVGDEPNSQDLQSVMEKVGPNKVLRNNAEIEAIDRDEMVDLVERSCIQAPLSRSLWTPHIPVSWDRIDSIVLVGGVANWQDRAADAIPHELRNKPIYNLGGIRVMDTATEVTNPNIDLIHSKFGRYPIEAEYAASVITPRLVEKRLNVLATTYHTKDGDAILDQFFEGNPELLEKSIAVVRVANAGVLMALQMRAAAQKHNPSFDTAKDDPQAFVITDTLPVARTDAEEKDAAHYQKAATALRQIVLTAKKLHEATATE